MNAIRHRAMRLSHTGTMLALAGCEGQQSVLSPVGAEAERVSLLFWILTACGGAILLGVLALAAVGMFGRSEWRHKLAGDGFVIGGGIVFPIVALTALFGYALSIMIAGSAARNGVEAVRISVVGERWWWRTIYTDAEGHRIESANEIRIPVGRPIAIELTTSDVIHSFWVPNLAGKLDMVPGRVNTLTLTANKPGISRGQCAEYCGGAHALMSFYVIAMPEPEYRAWLSHEATPAAQPGKAPEIQGRRLFLESGCGGCHTVRGTPATGTIGPDLTHVGSRMSLAAATLPNDAEAFGRWIRDNQHIKPENLMPPFQIFGEAELGILSTYLESLK